MAQADDLVGAVEQASTASDLAHALELAFDRLRQAHLEHAATLRGAPGKRVSTTRTLLLNAITAYDAAEQALRRRQGY